MNRNTALFYNPPVSVLRYALNINPMQAARMLDIMAVFLNAIESRSFRSVPEAWAEICAPLVRDGIIEETEVANLLQRCEEMGGNLVVDLRIAPPRFVGKRIGDRN